MQQCVEQSAAGIIARCEARFQLFAEGHEFIDFGDDAVLFGAGWEGNGESIRLLDTLVRTAIAELSVCALVR